MYSDILQVLKDIHSSRIIDRLVYAQMFMDIILGIQLSIGIYPRSDNILKRIKEPDEDNSMTIARVFSYAFRDNSSI